MIWMYLTEDIKGAYSKKVYGIIGDKVAILSNDYNLCLVLHESGTKFHCYFNQLSNLKINKEVKHEEFKKVIKGKKRI